MSGEESKDGTAHVEEFSRLVRHFGWRQHGDLDRNVKCQECPPLKITKERPDPEPREHGVDGLFTFDCPFVGQERAVLVDGKRYALGSMRGNLEKQLRSLVQTCSHLRRSPDFLNERGVDSKARLDTAILAWFCHKDWDAPTAERWRSEVNAGRSPVYPPVEGFVMTNTELNRLAVLVNYSKQVTELEFLYHNSHHGGSITSSSLAPELLHSDMIGGMIQEFADSTPELVVFYFGAVDPPLNVRFVFNYLKRCGQLTHRHCRLLAPCSKSEGVRLQAELDIVTQGLRRGTERLPKFVVETIPDVPYKA